MTVASPLSHRPIARGQRTAATVVAALSVAVIAALVLTAVRNDGSTPTVDPIQGSGTAATETRPLPPFTSVDLAGSNAVVIRIGQPQAVTVSADDNLVDHVTTTVRSGELVIDDRGSFVTKAPMHVTVTVPSLTRVMLTGSGTLAVERIDAGEFTAELAGTGTLQASGVTARLTATLSGTGELDLQALVADAVIARLEDTGDIHVHATASLDAAVVGTGSIRYTGNPTRVEKQVSGTGTISAE